MAVPNTPPATAAMAQSRLGRKPVAGQRAQGRARADIDFMIGPRVAGAMSCPAYERQTGDPVYRPLRIYALDPSASTLDGALAIVNVPYEPVQCGSRGPCGTMLEILDDAAEGTPPVDLDDKFVLMQQGRMPAPEDARFRQQMVYAVCMTTYAAFRQALGRDIAWGFRHQHESDGQSRLHVRTNVANLENAFYDRLRGELCFGVFNAGSRVAGRNIPGGRISLGLSHDVVVHEMSHALLDGLRSHFLNPSNLDVLAFHEAFADLIAIFQRFTYREVVLAAIRQTRGELSCANLMTNIAVQFAEAMNATGALRSAVGGTDRTYEDAVEPHYRGELLVAAIFEAFATIYERRTQPLLRLATDGSGVLPPGQISEVLAAQLTERASKLAAQFLSICIRAIDYCPPVDITFGEYLRAVVTADTDLVPDDEYAYREAWIDAFAKRRIYPLDVESLSTSALLWRGPEIAIPPEPELSFARLQFDGDPGRAASVAELTRQARVFGQLAADPRYAAEFGLATPNDPALDGDEVALPIVESIRTSRRIGPSGQVVFDLIAEITQRRRVKASGSSPAFDFYGGATAIIDPKGRVRYVIRKSVLDPVRLRQQRDFLACEGKQYFGKGPGNSLLPESKLLLKLHGITRPQLHAGGASRAVLGDVSKPAPPQPDRYLLRVRNVDPSVRLLKACLNQCLPLAPPLDSSTTFDEITERAVTRLQSEAGAAVDGIVGPATWTVIGRELKYAVPAPALLNGVSPWIVSLLTNDPRIATLTTVAITDVLDLYTFLYGPLSLTQREGLTYLLERLRSDTALTDLRWAAYLLATVKHECAERWRPVEEFGRGAGRAYGLEVEVTDTQGNVHRNKYYGRGYVQLTWKENYQRVGQAIGMGDDLMIDPDLALQPETAYKIMSYGMRAGAFTGRTLSHYITAERVDYENARRIVNGTDQAERIAGYAKRFESILLASIPSRNAITG